VRLHQAREDAEAEMRQAQLIAAMEAQAQEQTKAQLEQVLSEMAKMKQEKMDFVRKLSSLAGEHASAETNFNSLNQLMADLKTELSESRGHIQMLMDERTANDAKVRKIFEEREAMEAAVVQLEGALRNEKARAREAETVLMNAADDMKSSLENEIITARRQAAERESKLQWELTEKTKKLVATEEILESEISAHANQVENLQGALLNVNRELEAEKQTSKALQDQIDGIQKTIWLRKYDASSPRSPRPGYLHEHQSDTYVTSGTGVYAGQVGYTKF